MSNAAKWAPDKLEAFERYVSEYLPGATSIDPLARALDEDALKALTSRNSPLGEAIALAYCAWVTGTPFDFSFCDVIVKRLEAIFSVGTLGACAAAALAAARMGESHNRWFVMERLLSMCGPTLDENAAKRIALEIQASDAEEDFNRCASVINRTVAAYHPAIAGILTDNTV